jgi:hypothetical protein
MFILAWSVMRFHRRHDKTMMRYELSYRCWSIK